MRRSRLKRSKPAPRKWKTAKKIEYQEIIELTPQLMEELVKKIIIRPDGSIHIEWNFCDEIGEVIPFRSNLALEEKTI